MKRSALSLCAWLVAASLGAPAAADDMSAFLSPGALAGELGLDGSVADLARPDAPQHVQRRPTGAMIVPWPEALFDSGLAIRAPAPPRAVRVSLRPVPRPAWILRHATR